MTEISSLKIMSGLKDLSSKLVDVNRRVSSVTRRVDKMTSKDLAAKEASIDRFMKKVKGIEKQVSVLHLKVLVGSQIEWVSRDQFKKVGFSSIVLRAFDEPDIWWLTRELHTLEDWLLSLLELKKKYDKEDEDKKNHLYMKDLTMAAKSRSKSKSKQEPTVS